MNLSRLLPALYFFKRKVSQAKLWVWIKLGWVKSILIQPYLGFGSEKEIYLAGRVLVDKGITPANPEDRFWKNFRTMQKRFFTIVIPEVAVLAIWEGEHVEVQTDEEGYFEFRIHPKNKPDPAWHAISLSLKKGLLRNQPHVTAEGLIFIPSSQADFGVISDIDDTVVPTGAMRLWDMLKTTFAKNAHSRVPFPGVSAFYEGLHKGAAGIPSNPLFYVSSSPWNLYDFLTELMEVHQIPPGPLMLRDLGLSRDQLIAGSHRDHKLKQIRHILGVYPELNFILIGDSGQEDPVIYREIIEEMPGRILAVYIRNVANRELRQLQAEYQKLEVPFVLVQDTMEASAHAAQNGWILEADRSEIQRKKVKDEED
ncbi:App1 family protein [Algoriphagus hitonicola]|uniref:Phosphatidate phosphatase APP1 n=1 Tax=Algoriphagus hitonicola TaxID=435880 RepID=A0A1I2NHN9_9BACT|nr:phosphatase domain-containing protein [Algoriphagus hitonicola]SFG03123.1 Phosphatidate phosphatase APP1 [Algoriphagus hitonicola]